MTKIYRLTKKQNNYISKTVFAGVTVRLEFTGGNVFKNIEPKMYVNDKFRQLAIENSQEWKDGTIVLHQVIETPEEQNSAKTSVPAGKGSSPDGKGAGFVGSGTASASDYRDKNFLKGQSDVPDDGNNSPTGTAPVDDTQKMEFDNLADALVYAAQNFNVQAESEPAVRKVFAEHGIKVTIHKG